MTQKKFKYLDSQHRQYIALAVALLTYFLTRKQALPVNIMLTWIGYATSILVMSWISILSMHPSDVRRVASLEDSSVTFIFLFIIGSALASLFAVVLLLQSLKGLSKEQTITHVLLSIASVAVSWWLTHTVFTMRYAHIFYSTKNEEGGYGYGLEFPKEPCPDFMDFVYFSFVIGMTFQVSDVEISSRRIRRLAWLQGILSFVFNTAIVALSINIISGMFGH
ncbi:MAG: DUF1345 domain-containing protein [Mucilaginibacter sp.]|uniref:DUF1345 domain-containing protein n=1 Tax=Mucilaginibacter sp. TaxID=1882438 RepID=UPI0034E570C3